MCTLDVEGTTLPRYPSRNLRTIAWPFSLELILFTVSLWDKLLLKAELTGNVLRQSNTVSTVSAQTHFFGTFDFGRIPPAPTGYAVQLHNAANKRKRVAPCRLYGWYLGTSPDHYH